MAAIQATEVRELVEAAVSSISVLGGSMAYFSGFAAAQASVENSTPETLSQAVNESLGAGFVVGCPMALATLIIEACS